MLTNTPMVSHRIAPNPTREASSGTPMTVYPENAVEKRDNAILYVARGSEHHHLVSRVMRASILHMSAPTEGTVHNSQKRRNIKPVSVLASRYEH